MCFALAFWNGRDPFLKERLFGLSGHEGNHGEDVKECYFYLDNTPTHSYMKYLYKYPQAAFPYEQLVAENSRRTRHDAEYELQDTGIFDEDRYFDIAVEYAKRDAEDLLIRVRITNRGPEAAPIHVLPTLWFRDTWSWGRDPRRPSIVTGTEGAGAAGADRHAARPALCAWANSFCIAPAPTSCCSPRMKPILSGCSMSRRQLHMSKMRFTNTSFIAITAR